jgi:hypothetical protein
MLLRLSPNSRRVRHSACLLACCLLPLLPASAEDEDTRYLRGILDRFVGNWAGPVVLTLPNGTVVGRAQAETRYWWQTPEILASVSVYDYRGRLVHSRSRTVIRNRMFFSEVTQDNHVVWYRGQPLKDGIAWFPMSPEAPTENEVLERIQTTATGAAMLTIEALQHERGGSARGSALRLRAEMRKLPPEQD